jgi:hypothetical protein
VIIYLGKEVYQKRGVGCFVDMGVMLRKAKASYGCGCGKIPCIYIIKMAAAYRGIGGLSVAKKQHLLPHCNTIPTIKYFR